MSYDYAGYRRRQYDPPQAAQQLHPYQPVRPRRATCWDPPGSRDPPGIPPYDQPPPRYRHEPYGPPQPHRRGSVQNRRPTCWDPPGIQPLPSFQPYDPPQSRQPSCWEPPPRRASREYSDYDQPPLGPPSRWDPPDYHCPQTLQPTQFDRPLSHRTAPCPAQLAAVSDYNEKLRIYRLEQATLLAELNAWFEENSDDENLVEDVPNNAARNGGANLDVDVPIDESLEEIVKIDNMPLQVLVGVYDEKIGDLIVPTHREVALLDDVHEDNSTDTVKKVVASLNDVQVSSKKVVGNCWGKKEYGAYTDLPVISCVVVDLNVRDVPSLNHRSTSLDTDARLIPPRNDIPCLSILGGVNMFFILAWNVSGHVRSPWLIFYGGNRGIHSTIRYVFDPGDNAPTLLLSTLFVLLWFPP